MTIKRDLESNEPLTGKTTLYENRHVRVFTLPSLPWLVKMTARLPEWGIPVDIKYFPRSIRIQF